jgi:hypothetical protein
MSCALETAHIVVTKNATSPMCLSPVFTTVALSPLSHRPGTNRESARTRLEPLSIYSPQ